MGGRGSKLSLAPCRTLNISTYLPTYLPIYWLHAYDQVTRNLSHTMPLLLCWDYQE